MNYISVASLKYLVNVSILHAVLNVNLRATSESASSFVNDLILVAYTLCFSLSFDNFFLMLS